MTSFFGDDDRTQGYIALNLVMSILGTFASLINIALIYRMKVTTGHIFLILCMEYAQTLYDVTFFFSNVDCGYYVVIIANIFQICFGICSSLLSNWMAYIILHIVVHRQKFDVFENIKLILMSSLLPGFINAVIYAVATIPKENESDDLVDISILYLYYYIRFASIIFNFVIVLIILYKIDLMSSKTMHKSDQEIAIRTVARRMILYPIIQAISRSGYSWYEFQYGAEVSPTDSSPDKYACLIFLTIVTPMVSIGYLIIFLLMQPSAYDHLKALLFCQDHTVILKDENLVYRKTGSLHSSMGANNPSTLELQEKPKKEFQNLKAEPLRDSNFSRDSVNNRNDEPSQVEKGGVNEGGGEIDAELMSHASMYFRESSIVLRDTRNEADLFHIIEQDQLFLQTQSEMSSTRYPSSSARETFARDTFARSTFARSSAAEGSVFNSMHFRPDSFANPTTG